MPKVVIDDREIEVPEGTNMIQAAKLLGIEIPHFCYHPGTGIDGNCRMCLIEVDGAPKPQIACNLFAKDGLKIRTDTENVKRLRQAVLEFLFLNHPLDCPICDQSGECLLQDFYMRHGQYESRLDLPKVHKRKAIDVGPRVVLDAERCVLCQRCVRFCDLVTGTGELRVINRGNHSEIGVFPDKPLENKYSMNTVDICPVGALTSRDFRFKCRVWFLTTASSVCAGCARGCNVHLEQNEGVVYRIRPRENQAVNQWWMCDDGRLTYHPLNDARCEAPLLRGTETTHTAALEGIVSAVRAELDAGRGAEIAVLASPEMSNESLYALRSFARDVLGTARVAAGSAKEPWDGDDFLRRPDRNPNTKGCQVLGYVTGDPRPVLEAGGKLLLIVQNDVVDDGLPGAAELLDRFGTVIALATNVTKTTAKAAIVHPVTPHSECDGTFTNFQGRVQRFRRAVVPHGDALTVMELLRRVAAGLGKEFGWTNLNHVWKEMSSTVAEFAGMSPAEIGDQGMAIASARAEAEAGGAPAQKGAR